MQRAGLALLVAVFWAALYIFVPVLSPYAATMGAGLDFVGLIVGSYGLSQLFLRIPTGWLSDRLGRRKPFIVVGFLFTVLSCLLMAWAPSPWYLLLGRGLSGVAATMWVPLAVLVASAFPPEGAVAAMGLANFATNIGQIFGTMSGGWIAEQWGWGAPFVAAAGVAGLGAVGLAFVPEGKSTSTSVLTWAAFVEVVTNRRLLFIAGLGALVQYMTYVTVFGFTPVYATAIGASKAVLGWLTVASIIPSALAALSANAINQRLGTAAALGGGFLLTVVATAAIPFISGLPLLFASQIIGGFGRGLVFPVLMGLSIQTVPGERRALAMGLFQSLYAIGMFTGPVVAGEMGRLAGMPGVFLSTAVVGVLASVVAYTSKTKHPSSRSAA